jgi:hypothetical protein
VSGYERNSAGGLARDLVHGAPAAARTGEDDDLGWPEPKPKPQGGRCGRH